MSSFYSTESALRHDAPSYVERPADQELLNNLLRGEFCSVLAPRHLGKSSLMIRAAQRLQEHGVHVVLLNLEEVRRRDTAEEWCGALLANLGRQLHLERELADFWKDNDALQPSRRFVASLREVVLPALKDRDQTSVRTRSESRSPASLSDYHASLGRCVVFLDDIDAARELPFDTADFFHEIQASISRRGEDAEFNRLCFCLLGVAMPGSSPGRMTTPLPSLGRLVEVLDFTAEQAAGLAAGLKLEPVPPEESDAPARPRLQIQNVNPEKILLERVLYWTGGHPYLTQRLCQALSEALRKPASGQSTLATRDLVDQQCDQLFFSRLGRETDAHLQAVEQALFGEGVDRSALLELFGQVRRGQAKSGPPHSRALAAILVQSGLVRSLSGSLRLRNRIYERTFDTGWITRQMPEAEWHRQQAAYRRGFGRAAAAGAVLVVLLTALALISFRQSRLASDAAARNARAARENRDQLVELTVANGTRLLEQGAVLSALPWFAEAMNRVETDPVQQEMHRFRLQALLRQCPRLIWSLSHEKRVDHVEFSPDGRWLVTASADHTAQVWDLVSGERLTAPLRHDGPVSRASFSRDARRLITSCADGTARLWETASGKELTPPLRHAGPVLDARFSPKGDQVATASADGTARVWNVSNGAPITGPMAHPGPVREVVFSPDGRRLATASSGNSGRVWDALTGQPVTPLLAHAGAVNSVCFRPDGKQVLTASQDGTARIWDAATGAASDVLFKHEAPVSHASFSPDGRQVVTASLDQTAQAWDAVTGEPVGPRLPHRQVGSGVTVSPDGRRILTLQAGLAEIWDVANGIPALAALEHGAAVLCAAFGGDGDRVVTGCLDGAIRVWNVAAALGENLVLPHKAAVHSAVFSPNGQKLLTASGDGLVQVWDTGNGRGLGQRLVHAGHVYQALFSPQGHHILTVCEDGAAQLVDDMTGGFVGKPMEHDGIVQHAAFSVDGRWFVSASADHTARVWETATGNPATPPLLHDGPVTDAGFSPSGDRVLTASLDQTVRIWDPRHGRELRPRLKHQEPVNQARFSFDGRRIISASGHEARVWDSLSGQPVTPPLRHDGIITAVAFSPDNRHVLTTGWDRRARVWSAATGAPVTPWFQHRGPIAQAAFSPDGLRLATASWDGTAMVWDVFTGQPLVWPLRHGAAVTALGFSADGHRLATASHDRTARIWNLPSEDRPASGLTAWAQVTAGQRVESNGAALPLDRLALREALSKLRSKHPSDLGLAEEQTLAWHGVEASRAEGEGEWYAAVFHLERLTTALPQDKTLRNRHSSALAEWIRSSEQRNRTRPGETRLARDPKAEPGMIDLSNYYNDALGDETARNILAALPHGLHLLARTPFDVRGAILLAGEASSPKRWPDQVAGIRLNQKCRRLHFLQASAGGSRLTEGTVIGKYVVNFGDGQKREIPIRYADDVADWQAPANASLTIKGAVVAWTGGSASSSEAGVCWRLFKTSLDNPLPETEIATIDFVSAKTQAAPVLVALTAEP